MMYRRHVLVILIVVFAALTNAPRAHGCLWIDGWSRDWCCPSNWDCGEVPGPPGPQDDATIGPAPPPGPIIDTGCGAICGDLQLADNSLDVIGGSLTVTGSARFADFEESQTATVNICGDALVNFAGRWRNGDEGGTVDINISGNSVVNIEQYFRIGDDGGGSFTVAGNAQVNVGLDENEDGMLYFVCRENSVTVDISGNCEVWSRERFSLGNPGQAGGDAATTCHMTMSGGTLSAERVQVGWDPDGDFVASLTMTGGLVICREDLQVGPTSTVALDGGVIEILGDDSLEIDDGGSINITGGSLVLAGNKAAEIAALVCREGKITGYGTPAGVVIDYDNINPGKTTVYGVGVDSRQAYCPEPANGADKVRPTGVWLRWVPGSDVGRIGGHRVYFGTDEQAVEDANMIADEYIAQTRSDMPEYYVGDLLLWVDYFWRIDEVNDDFTVTKGVVWKFTTGCELIPGDVNRDCIVDFKDYAKIAETWQKKQLWPPQE